MWSIIATMRVKNKLWQPPKGSKQPKQSKKQPKDEICKQCINIRNCKGLCPLIISINGRSETKEIIPAQPIISRQGYEQQDYNQALYEMIADQQARDVDRLDTIRGIKDYRIRAIAACILAHIPQAQIAKLVHTHQGSISKLYRAVKKS